MNYCNVISSAFPCLMDPNWSEGDQECIFFTVNTYQATFISEILLYDYRNWKFDRTDVTDMKIEIVL